MLTVTLNVPDEEEPMSTTTPDAVKPEAPAEPEQPEPGAELAPRASDSFALAERFTKEQREQIATFLTIEADEPALVPYLAICQQYDLSPVMGEIWLIPQKNRILVNGEWTDGPTKLRPAVGRDGLLKIARSQRDFLGVPSAVVCANDTFEVEYTGDVMTDPKVLHRYRSKPTSFAEGEDPREYRGAILGAWAKLMIHGKIPTYYVADLREHGKVKRKRTTGEVLGWQGAWEYTSAMILKAAVSYVCRLGVGVSGIVPVDEMSIDATAVDITDERGELPAEVDPDEHPVAAARRIVSEELRDLPDELRMMLSDELAFANERDPFSWSAAKIRMTLAGRGSEVARRVLAELLEVNDRYRTADENPAVATGLGPIDPEEGEPDFEGEPGDDGPPDAEVVPDEDAEQAELDDEADAADAAEGAADEAVEDVEGEVVEPEDAEPEGGGDPEGDGAAHPGA